MHSIKLRNAVLESRGCSLKVLRDMDIDVFLLNNNQNLENKDVPTPNKF